MPGIRAKLLGRLALRLGFLTRSQLDDALAYRQFRARKRGARAPDFATVLLDKGYMTAEQLDRLRHPHQAWPTGRRGQGRPYFGELVVALGLAARTNVKRALETQAERAANDPQRQPPRIGELLVSAGHLRPHQVAAIVALQGRKTTPCPVCGAVFDLGRLGIAPGTKLRCDECAAALIVEPHHRLALDPQSTAMIGPAQVSAILDLGGYRLDKRLGSDATGTIYRAVSTKSGAPVAIKRFSRALVQDPHEAHALLQRLNEAARVRHPNVRAMKPPSGAANDRIFVLMEYIEGVSLRIVHQRHKRLPWPAVVGLLKQALAGLAAIHAAGLVHQDVRPATLLLDERGTLKIGGLGLGLGEHTVASLLAVVASGERAPFTIAPEAILAGDETVALSAASDCYALGAIAYLLLTGVPPHVGESPFEVLAQMAECPVVPIAELVPEVPAPYAEFVMRLLALDVRERFADAGQAAGAFGALLVQTPPPPADLRPQALGASSTRASREPGLPVIDTEGTSPRPMDAVRRPRPLLRALVLFLVLGGVAVGVALLVQRRSARDAVQEAIARIDAEHPERVAAGLKAKIAAYERLLADPGFASPAARHTLENQRALSMSQLATLEAEAERATAELRQRIAALVDLDQPMSAALAPHEFASACAVVDAALRPSSTFARRFAGTAAFAALRNQDPVAAIVARATAYVGAVIAECRAELDLASRALKRWQPGESETPGDSVFAAMNQVDRRVVAALVTLEHEALSAEREQLATYRREQRRAVAALWTMLRSHAASGPTRALEGSMNGARAAMFQAVASLTATRHDVAARVDREFAFEPAATALARALTEFDAVRAKAIDRLPTRRSLRATLSPAELLTFGRRVENLRERLRAQARAAAQAAAQELARYRLEPALLSALGAAFADASTGAAFEGMTVRLQDGAEAPIASLSPKGLELAGAGGRKRIPWQDDPTAATRVAAVLRAELLWRGRQLLGATDRATEARRDLSGALLASRLGAPVLARRFLSRAEAGAIDTAPYRAPIVRAYDEAAATAWSEWHAEFATVLAEAERAPDLSLALVSRWRALESRGQEVAERFALSLAVRTTQIPLLREARLRAFFVLAGGDADARDAWRADRAVPPPWIGIPRGAYDLDAGVVRLRAGQRLTIDGTRRGVRLLVRLLPEGDAPPAGVRLSAPEASVLVAREATERWIATGRGPGGAIPFSDWQPVPAIPFELRLLRQSDGIHVGVDAADAVVGTIAAPTTPVIVLAERGALDVLAIQRLR